MWINFLLAWNATAYRVKCTTVNATFTWWYMHNLYHSLSNLSVWFLLFALVHPKFHWLRQIATTLCQFHWHLFSIGHCAWFYKRGKRGSYLVLAIAPFWSWIEPGPKIAIWHSQWNLGYTFALFHCWPICKLVRHLCKELILYLLSPILQGSCPN